MTQTPPGNVLKLREQPINTFLPASPSDVTAKGQYLIVIRDNWGTTVGRLRTGKSSVHHRRETRRLWSIPVSLKDQHRILRRISRTRDGCGATFVYCTRPRYWWINQSGLALACPRLGNVCVCVCVCACVRACVRACVCCVGACVREWVSED